MLVAEARIRYPQCYEYLIIEMADREVNELCLVVGILLIKRS